MKLVIFDIDGTLTSTSGVDNEFLSQVISELVGISRIDTNWEHYPTFTDTGIARHVVMENLKRALTAGEAAQLENDFLKLIKSVGADQIRPVEGSKEFFASLIDSKNHEVAIATGSWKTSAVHKLSTAGIPHEGVPMATCNDSDSREEIMRTAEARAYSQYGQSRFEETIYFGDGIWDVHATRSLNWRMVGIGENIERLKQLGAEHVFEDYQSPLEILATIDARK